MKTILITIILLCLGYSNSVAQENITLKWLTKQPRSIAKDFYIWRYLNQDITSNDASLALGQVRRMNNQLLFRYAKKYKDIDMFSVVSCMKSNAKSLVSKNADCIKIGMSTFKATKLSDKQLSIVINKTKNKYPKSSKIFEIIQSKKPFERLIKSSNDVFFNTFNQCGGKFRVNNFNKKLPKKFISQLQNDKRFAQTIKLIVTNKKLNNLQKSILNINTKNFSHKMTFHLAINAIRLEDETTALKYLEQSYNNAYFQQDKDKVLCWQYLITKKQKYLKQLSESWDNNIYSLMAFEKYNIKPKNIVYNLDINNSVQSNYDYKVPFNWFPILRDTKKMTNTKMLKYNKLFNNLHTQGHLAFVKERFFRYKKSYFITPYKNELQNINPKRKALIYAIARQESRFIQTSISSAYALGVMQIMPFLSKALSKQLKIKYDIDKQLEAKTSIMYANKHLDFLDKRLKNPLFIAYAYNGGIGFMRRMLKSGLFKKGKYEPYLSMEMLPYDETKKYGKKVLANYFIYYNHLNENKIKISTLFQKILK